MLGSYATCEKVTPTLRKSVKLDKAKRLLKKDALKKVSLISRFINMTSKDNGKFQFFQEKLSFFFRKRLVMERKLLVLPHCRWQMEPNVLIEANAEGDNVCHFARHKIFKYIFNSYSQSPYRSCSWLLIEYNGQI